MADRIWRGDSVPKAQVTCVTPNNVEAGDTFRLVVNGKQIEYVTQDATVHDAVQGLVEAWNESTIPEFAEITAAAVDANADGEYEYLTLTADEPGKPFTVTSGTGNTIQTNDPSITIEETVRGIEPTNEQQKVTLDSPATGGTFTASWNGQTTGALAYNITAAEFKTALEGLSNISVGDVSVIGGPLPSSPIYVTFGGAYAGTDVPLITIDGTNLTGGGSVTVTTTREGSGKTSELHYISTQGVGGGSFNLTINGIDLLTQFNVQTGAMGSQLQARIDERLGAGNVTVYSLDTSSIIGSAYFLEFKGALAGINVPATIIHTSQLTNPAAAFVSTPANGGGSAGNEFGFVNLQNSPSGTFTLTINGTTTPPIDVGASGTLISRITSEVEAITGAGTVVVTPIKDYSDGTEFPNMGFWFEFINGMGSQPIAWSFNGSGLSQAATVAAHRVRPGSSILTELQSVRVNGSGGTFTLTYSGQTTAAINFGAPATGVGSLEEKLEALSNITDVAVTGAGTAASPYVVEFVDPAGNVTQMTGDGSLLTGGSGHAVTTVNASAGTDEQQTITLVETAGGTFTVQFRGSTSAAIAWDASATSLQSILEGIATIGAGNVSVAGVAGGPWTVTFIGALGTENVELLIADDSGLIGTPGSDTQTLVIATNVASGGPNHWDDPANWTGNAVPATGDDVYIASGTSDILFGLQQASVTLASMTVHSRYAGRIGLPERTETGYWEYRPTYLAIGASVITIGNGEGTGSGRIKLNTGAVQTAITVLNTGGAIEPGLPALQWKGVHAGNSMLVLGGDVGVAVLATETAQLDLTERGGSVELGSGVSLGRLDKTGGELRADDAVLSGALIIRG